MGDPGGPVASRFVAGHHAWGPAARNSAWLQAALAAAHERTGTFRILRPGSASVPSRGARARPMTPSVGRVGTDGRPKGTRARWWAIGVPVTMAVVAGFSFYVPTNDGTIAVAAALLALVVFGGLSIYVGRWTASQPSAASSSGPNRLHVLILALAVAGQISMVLEAPTFVPVVLVVLIPVVAGVDQLVRRGEGRRLHVDPSRRPLDDR
jgi:hypothetical protein